MKETARAKSTRRASLRAAARTPARAGDPKPKRKKKRKKEKKKEEEEEGKGEGEEGKGEGEEETIKKNIRSTQLACKWCFKFFSMRFLFSWWSACHLT